MPTATATLPLQSLADRISQREKELAILREELAAHEMQFTALAQRKEELLAQLKQVEEEMANVERTATAAAAPPMSNPTPSASPKSTSTSTQRAAVAVSGGGAKSVTPSERISLPKLLVSLVQRANKPVSINDLVEGVVRNKYPTKAKDLHAMIENRVSDLVRAKALKRVANQPGVVVLGKASAQPATTKATSFGSNGTEKVATAKPVGSTKSTGSGQKLSLKDAMLQVLAKTSRPLPAQELAERVVANGYETKSKDLKNVIWVAAGKLENVENVKGEGYRLKAANAKMNKKK